MSNDAAWLLAAFIWCGVRGLSAPQSGAPFLFERLVLAGNRRRMREPSGAGDLDLILNLALRLFSKQNASPHSQESFTRPSLFARLR